MHHFFLPPSQCKTESFDLTDAEAHHALHVLRVRPGEKVTVLDGVGTELHCEVKDTTRKTISLHVIEKKLHAPPLSQITLLQSLPKGKIIESIIQKATELGAHRIVPILAERSVTKLDAKEAARKQEKWQAIAVEALKQSGSPWLPRVETPVSPTDFLAQKELFELPLIASLQPGSEHPHKWFSDFKSHQNRPPKSVCIWIGPEGDFTSEETALIRASGCQPITLGRLVLRVETAAVYCLSIINHELSTP